MRNLQTALDLATDGKATDRLRRSIAGAIADQVTAEQYVPAIEYITAQIGDLFERLDELLVDPTGGPVGQLSTTFHPRRASNREAIRSLIAGAVASVAS